jgi:hypothetical protein
MLALLLAAWNLTQAVVVTPARLSPVEQKAVTVLVEEVEKRTAIRWPVATQWPAAGSVAVVVTPARSLGEFRGAVSERAGAARGRGRLPDLDPGNVRCARRFRRGQ